MDEPADSAHDGPRMSRGAKGMGKSVDVSRRLCGARRGAHRRRRGKAVQPDSAGG